MANDSLLADAITAILADEIDLDVVRVTRRDLGKGDPQSVVIVVDEGESEDETINVTDLFRAEITLLVIKISLRSRNIFIYESYQLNNPAMERLVNLVRDFSRTNLKKNAGGDEDAASQKKIKGNRRAKARRHDWSQSHAQVARLSRLFQLTHPSVRRAGRGGELSNQEISQIFDSIFVQHLRRIHPGNVTLLPGRKKRSEAI
jgi:hypothetical protein